MSKKEININLDDFEVYEIDPTEELLKKKKRQKRVKRNRILLLFVVVLLLLAVFMTDLLKVKSIKVKGNSQVPDSLIINSLSIKDNKPYFFLFNKEEAAREVTKIGLIKSADVSVDLIGNVTVKVTEAKKIAYSTIGKLKYVVDEKGHTMSITKSMKIDDLEEYPKITGFKTLKDLKAFVKEYIKIPVITRNSISDIKFDPTKVEPNRVRFIMDDGRQLVLRIDEMAYLLEKDRFNYEAFIKKNGQYNVFEFYGTHLYMRK